ncbi:MAG: hypothetical protein K0R76_431 [Alphaproteobacteria bacterium]|jgi:aryl-alcohol dehydrogenase-like predicted oxidoreductase|nr:hypothetical protein [Alphaproteobacteria bacterium]
MFNKIIIGTANFIKPYGILSSGKAVPENEIHTILDMILDKGINTLDTALGYGDISQFSFKKFLSNFKVITKFSVLDDEIEILKNFSLHKNNFQNCYGLLIHDPQNIPLVSKHKLEKLLSIFRHDYGVKKIGVSVYDMADIENFNSICMPDIIQIPLNPFNQYFNNAHFKSFVKDNDIEIHARSLFLQGILLSNHLPDALEPLTPFWVNFQKSIANSSSHLHATLQWAFNIEWVKCWVLGVSSVENVQNIINVVSATDQLVNAGALNEFQPVDHPLVDPRNWELS